MSLTESLGALWGYHPTHNSFLKPQPVLDIRIPGMVLKTDTHNHTHMHTHTHTYTKSFTQSFLSSLSSYFYPFLPFCLLCFLPTSHPAGLSIGLYLFFHSPSFCFFFLPLLSSFFTFFSFGRSTGEVQETPYCQTRVLQGNPIASNMQRWWETLKGWHAPRTSWKCVACGWTAANSRRRCLPFGWFWVEAAEVVGGV